MPKNNIAYHNSQIMFQKAAPFSNHMPALSQQFRSRLFYCFFVKQIKLKILFNKSRTLKDNSHIIRSNTATQKEKIWNWKLHCVPITLNGIKSTNQTRTKRERGCVYARAICLGENDDLVGIDGFVNEFTHRWSWRLKKGWCQSYQHQRCYRKSCIWCSHD